MIRSSASKLCSLSELAARIDDGAAIGVGGVFLHRGPFALMRELVRQGRRGLEFIKPSRGCMQPPRACRFSRWRA